MEKLSCSVVIVSYYTNESLFECLAALFAEQSPTFALDVIVVDNGNPERHSKRLSAFAEQGKIQWLKGQGNIGFAAGCNLGVANAKHEAVLLLNPDCISVDNAVQRLYDFWQQQPNNTVVSGWVTNPDGSEQRGLRRNYLTPLSLLIEMLPLINRLPLLRNYRLNLTDKPIDNDVIEVPACSGACILFGKALFQQLGGMDEAYFLHVDDLDFCRRLGELGGRILVHRQMVFSHYQGTSLVSGKRVEKYKRDSFYYYFSKYHPISWKGPIGWGLRLAIQLKFKLSKG